MRASGRRAHRAHARARSPRRAPSCNRTSADSARAPSARARGGTVRRRTARRTAPPQPGPTSAPHKRAWNTGSSVSRSIRPKPCMPPRSWIPSTPRAPRRSDERPADHAIARHQRGESILAPAVGAHRSLRQNHVAQVGGAVPDPHCLLGRQDQTELGEHRSGSRTTRARYGADLYQTGGRPRTGQG
jgi:hypothetical protein